MKWRAAPALLSSFLLACVGGGTAATHRADTKDAESITVATYNIRHGRGMDGRVDLARTAAAIQALNADVIALQEVDNRVERSGGVDQATDFGERLKLHHAFGAFFPYQGGEYGMAILSRLPIRRTQFIRLPDGNEPRIALLVEVELPSGRRVAFVNVHFDWVDDDAFRYAQVMALSAVLDTLKLPVILLGDFNDQPGSRTMNHWRERFATVAKPAQDRFTFSSTLPEKEIDHILLAPIRAWNAATGRVLSDSVTSDHRAFVAQVRFR